jgi:cohesin complex subunit SA-1/2
MPSQRLPLMELSENDAPSSNATAKRRVSGRAVRAPEKFVPDAPSSQAGNAGGKRKRGADKTEDIENEVDEEEEESDEEEDDDEESPNEEEVRQAKKKARTSKKPVAKKAKVNGTASDAADAPAPTVRLPNRQKKPKKVVIQDAKAEGLYGKHTVLRGFS